jgi:small nuclear ribonucleoprotein (snRNP)-like protein
VPPRSFPAVERHRPQLPATPPDSILVAVRALLDGSPRYSRSCASPNSVVPTHTGPMASPLPFMSFTSPVVPVNVCALLHNGQLIRGMFVSFDPVWNPILQDWVEIHPQAGRHVPGPLVLPCAAIASLAVEPVSSPSLTSASIGAPSLALSAHTVPSPPPPPPPTTDWVVDSGVSFHTTPTTSSLFHYHPPHPSHPSSIVVGNGSTLPVTSVGASVLLGPFCLNDVLVAPGLTHPLLLVRRFTSDNQCSMEFDP